MSDRRVLGVYDKKAEAWGVLRRFRESEPHGRFYLIDVRYADPPIRTVNRWAVVRLGGGRR